MSEKITESVNLDFSQTEDFKVAFCPFQENPALRQFRKRIVNGTLEFGNLVGGFVVPHELKNTITDKGRDRAGFEHLTQRVVMVLFEALYLGQHSCDAGTFKWNLSLRLK